MIDSKRSKFKKITVNYNKDNVFNIIDIEEALKKNKFIKKIPLDICLYRNELKNMKKEEFSFLNKKDINNNKFNIKIEELRIQYNNGYICRLNDRYTPLQLIGEGGFSIVISAVDKSNNCTIAIKIIFKKIFPNIDEYLSKEVFIQDQMDHKNIVKLYDVIDNEDYMYMFMEFMQGGSLKDLIIDRYQNDSSEYLFQDHECSLIMRGILEGIDYLHSRNIMHRDIKPGKT
jgi:hypothetical protein